LPLPCRSAACPGGERKDVVFRQYGRIKGRERPVVRLRVLGCSGGIGGRHLRTTSFLVDSDILIDAGTGVGDLTLAELSQIDSIFITHSHLDHVTSIPFLVDTVGGMRSKPLVVYATRATLEILRNHLFNWAIWPDFSEIPTPQAPFLRYQEIALGETVTLGARRITPLPARHTVPDFL
jgi:Cft2 family RNA processing exonuclease